MTHDCQILCFWAVLAIGIATNSIVCRVFIHSQYGAFTERLYTIIQNDYYTTIASESRRRVNTQSGYINVIKNNEVIFNLFCMAQNR